MQPLSDLWAAIQTWLFESAVLPLLYATGGSDLLEQAYDGVEWFMAGIVEIMLIASVGLLFERLLPAEKQAWLSNRQVRVDMVYTFIHRSGLFPLFVFMLLTPLFDSLESMLRMQGIVRPSLEDALPDTWRHPLFVFVMYLLALDFVDYWIHRAQHRWQWWWALHSLHHSQQTMTVWSDNRNHLLDDFLRDAIMATAALLLGLPPSQFLWVVVFTRLMQSFQHGNLRISMGWLGDRVFVAPWFHRIHHSIRDDVSNAARGHNFAVLFPVWDLLFKTADMNIRYEPTGIADQLEGRNYGDGFFSQQWRSLRRMVGIR